MPINVLVGKNNSGKSTILDLVRFACAPAFDPEIPSSNIPQIELTSVLTERHIERVFAKNVSGGEIEGNHFEYGKKFIGASLTYKLRPEPAFLSSDPAIPLRLEGLKQQLARVQESPLNGLAFCHLLPNRDILPEGPEEPPRLRPNGSGTTALIQAFLHKDWYDHTVVEKEFLGALNEVLRGDAHFTRITSRHQKNGQWEIYLEEANKGLISLADSGNGLKTIIIVLCYFILAPTLQGKTLDQYVFGFEEIENNLHPALLRRFLSYIRMFCQKHGCILVLTTHSSIAIDYFANDSQAQILHVVHDGTRAQVTPSLNYATNKKILEDLDVRASDLLQANCIVWVEGPSDRIYFNRWIEIFSKDTLHEGSHYQCAFYGGKLLSHYSAQPRNEVDEFVHILGINRNAILIADRDRNAEQAPNATKERVVREIEAADGYAWVTTGREVENYLPLEAVRKLLKRDIAEIGMSSDFGKCLAEEDREAGLAFERSKPRFAIEVGPFLTEANLATVRGLRDNIRCCIDHIRRWNGLPRLPWK